MTDQLRSSVHSPIAKLFHWGFLILLGYGLAKQVDEVEELADAAFLLEEFVFASIFLVLLSARFLYMRAAGFSAMPPDFSPRLRRLARAVHLGMYCSLAGLALSGLAIGGMFALGSREGFVFASVLWLHEACYWASVNLIVLHVLGALYHRHLGDGVWNAMVPVMREKPADAAHRTDQQ